MDKLDKTYKPTELDIAYHEAGHAVTATLFYGEIAGVSILPTLDDGLISHGQTYFDLPSYPIGFPTELNFVDYLKIIIALLAGNFFQKKNSGYNDIAGAKRDIDMVKLYIADDDETGELYKLFSLKVDVFTYEFCSNSAISQMVANVANALIEKKQLSGTEVLDIIRKTPLDVNLILSDIVSKRQENFLNQVNLKFTPRSKSESLRN